MGCSSSGHMSQKAMASALKNSSCNNPLIVKHNAINEKSEEYSPKRGLAWIETAGFKNPSLQTRKDCTDSTVSVYQFAGIEHENRPSLYVKHMSVNEIESDPNVKCRPTFTQIYQPPLKLGGAGRVIQVSDGEVCERNGMLQAEVSKDARNNSDDNEIIFKKAKKLASKKSCETGVNYLAEKAFTGRSPSAALYLSSMMSPIKSVTIQSPKTAHPIPERRLYSGNKESDYFAAISLLRSYFIELYVRAEPKANGNGNAVSLKSWPVFDKNYQRCSKLSQQIMCRDYAIENSFVLSEIQSMGLWNEVKNHNGFGCQRISKFKSY